MQENEALVAATSRVYVKDDTRTIVLLDVAYADADRVQKALDMLVLASPPPPALTAPTATATVASTVTTTATATATETEPTPSVSRLGATISFADSEWIVMEARDVGKEMKSNSEFVDETKTTQGRFIQVHYKVTNTTKKEEMLLDRPKIVDGRGREFGPVDMESFYVPRRAKTIGLDTLQPSIAKEYWTVIEVATGANDLAFRVHGFSLTGPTRDVPLGL